MLNALEIAVEILVRTDHQEFERVLIQDSVGQQAQQIAHAEFVDLYARQVTDFGFSNVGLTGDRADSLVERSLLLTMQLFDCALERGGDEDAHQPNWYSPTGSS
uniref:Uncharacterized protein n=1 Tax=Ralstonia solanacearum TaxID=305 RepID=A0A0S4U0R8_RALSL|nr:protein of unknown function [Ralstonia solanacearum]